ncbi:hypothetical protein A3715_10425 [Oleiphilus sp. HI0009]|nr:hypothetical protein A3715_10425 [Oleiphilus sp. HI0009]
MISSLNDADEFKKANLSKIDSLMNEAELVDNVVHSELWVNGNCPSFVAGFNDEDEWVVSYKIG